MYSLSLTIHVQTKSMLLLLMYSTLFCLYWVFVVRAVSRLWRCHGFLSASLGRRWRCRIRGLRANSPHLWWGEIQSSIPKHGLLGSNNGSEKLSLPNTGTKRRRFRKVERESAKRKQHLIKRICDCERAALSRLKVIALPLNPTPDNAHTLLLPWQHPPHND